MESRNFIFAFTVSFFILYVYQYIFDERPADAYVQAKQIENPIKNNMLPPTLVSTTRKEDAQKVKINSSSIEGFLYAKGNEIDNVSLHNYKQSVGGTDNVVVLGKKRYRLSTNYLSNDKIRLPDDSTVWTVGENKNLTPATPVILTWDNGDGLEFQKTISIDERFLIRVDTKVSNKLDRSVKIRPNYVITYLDNKEKNSNWILHEGAVAYLSESLKEIEYKDMISETKTYSSKGGWAGFTDKYWLVAVIPNQNALTSVNIGSVNIGRDTFPSLSVLDPEIELAPGETKTTRVNMFVGAKEIEILDYYEQKLNIKHFDLAVDYGYLYFMTKPLSYLMIMLNEYAGNIGIAILLITIIIKLLLFPLASKSYLSMQRMKSIQPKIKQIQNIYADDKQRLNEELFKLYKKEKINPAGSCLPMFLQLPFMFALYKVMLITIEMRHAPFYGWIDDLSVADPTSIFNLFGLLPFSVPQFLQIGAWPIIMGITMFIQQAATPQMTTDAHQKRIMMMMPILFTYMMSSFSVGLIIYWTFSNVLQILQQYAIEKFAKTGKKAK